MYIYKFSIPTTPAEEAGVSRSSIAAVTTLHQLRELTVVAKRFRLLNSARDHEIMEINTTNQNDEDQSVDSLDISQLRPGDAVQGLEVVISKIESNGSVYMESAGGVEWMWRTSLVRDVVSSRSSMMVDESCIFRHCSHHTSKLNAHIIIHVLFSRQPTTLVRRRDT